MATKTTNLLSIRVTAEWLRKLDYLIQQDGATSRSNYIKTLIETRYALDKEVGDLLMQSMQEGLNDEAANNK